MIYAVNKRTKEHRDITGNGDVFVGSYAANMDWDVFFADPDGWIEWQGGECPLPDGFRCDVIHRSGFSSLNRPADGWAWGRDYEGDDIIAYRPILDTKVSHPGTMAGPDKYRSDGGEWPAWDGEGLPPVGARGVDGDGDIVEVVAHHHGHAVCYLVDYADHQYIDVEYSQFRPIRSEEDRITEEFERLMYKPAMTREMAARIYEAIRDGKVPGVKLEDT